MKSVALILFGLFLGGKLMAASSQSSAEALRMARYNVVWNSPSKNPSGVMPIGNGDMAAGVYVIENGDLYLLLSKNDAFTYMGDLFKTGRLRIKLSPNPFTEGKPFKQTLDLPTGSIVIEAGDVRVRIWTEIDRPLTHVEIHAARKLSVNVTSDLWKRFDSLQPNFSCLKAGQEPPQDIRLEKDGKILWYFAVGGRSVFTDDLKYYNVPQMAGKFPDPYRFNTFGNLIDSPDLKLQEGSLQGTGRNFDIRIYAQTLQTPEPGGWIKSVLQLASEPVDLESAWSTHVTWWNKFWNRGWIVASDRMIPPKERNKLDGEAGENGFRHEKDAAALVSQSYNVFRFLMACQSRGKIQVKFNGGLFTQQLLVPDNPKVKRYGDINHIDGKVLTAEDDRLWGRRFTFQNQRLLYWPLLGSGDFDLMTPFFRYYSGVLPMREAITKAWFGHDGAYFRENIEPTGAERDCGIDGHPRKGPGPARFYHDYYFTSGLEITAMMIDYFQFTGDTRFRDEVLLPFAREIVKFFDQHYSRGTDGKLRIEPAQVLETYWLATNPTPDIAGLRFCLSQLIDLTIGNSNDIAFWKKILSETPAIPMREVDGHPVIAPAEKWDLKHNLENGELYSVFPFRCFGVALGSGDLVRRTLAQRVCVNAFGYRCWTQDQIDFACAGDAAEAAKGLEQRFRSASPSCRFPLYGGEGPDSCPDFDHFGAGSVALQKMILQEAGNKIILLPSWPAKWDLDFKLHASAGVVVSGTVKNGKLQSWAISPNSRKNDVILCAPQSSRDMEDPHQALQ